MSVADNLHRMERADLPEAMALRRLDALARVMDSAIPIPFGKGATIGADALIGLVPGIGDAVSTAISGYLIYEAHGLGVPKRKLARMGLNTVIDGALGAIPVIGDVFDILFRANDRNLAIIREHLEQERRLFDSHAERKS